MSTAPGTPPPTDVPGDGHPRPVVLQSVRQVRATTNPYIVQLLQGLGAEAEVRTFTWRSALLGRWDVLHLHWPELLYRRAGTARTWAGMVLFALLMLRVRVGRRPLVRTVHNVDPHESGPGAERLLLGLCDRWTTLRILLHESVRVPDDVPTVVVPHGDYSDWFAGHRVPPAVPGRLLTFGLVRPYKGVEELIEVFRSQSAASSLHVVGKPLDDRTASAVRAAAGDDPRVGLTLRYVGDETLAQEIGEAELVVLPYRAMQNSGAALLALSLGRPVLVPDNPLTADLAQEVGPGWVHRFSGRLAAGDVERALEAARRRTGAPAPDLTARRWPAVTAAHHEAYRRARSLARSAGPAPRRAALLTIGGR